MTSTDLTQQYGAPPAAGTSGTIGVPEGYKPPLTEPAGPPPPGRTDYLQTSLGTAASKHVYVDGDEFGPMHEPHAQIIALQDALVKAGLLDPTTYHKGVWDTNSAAAYKIVLANANGYGASAPDMLNAMVANPPARLKAQKAPYELTNPIGIAATVSGGGPHQSNTARELLGKDLPASEVQAFTKWYQDQETLARTAYQSAGSGSPYTSAPPLDAAAAEYIRQHNGPDAIAYGTASRMFDFFDLLKGPV